MLLCLTSPPRAVQIPHGNLLLGVIPAVGGAYVASQGDATKGFLFVAFGLVILLLALGQCRRISVEGDHLVVRSAYGGGQLLVASLVFAVEQQRTGRGVSYTVIARQGSQCHALIDAWTGAGARNALERLKSHLGLGPAGPS